MYSNGTLPLTLPLPLPLDARCGYSLKPLMPILPISSSLRKTRGYTGTIVVMAFEEKLGYCSKTYWAKTINCVNSYILKNESDNLSYLRLYSFTMEIITDLKNNNLSTDTVKWNKILALKPMATSQRIPYLILLIQIWRWHAIEP